MFKSNNHCQTRCGPADIRVSQRTGSWLKGSPRMGRGMWGSRGHSKQQSQRTCATPLRRRKARWLRAATALAGTTFSASLVPPEPVAPSFRVTGTSCPPCSPSFLPPASLLTSQRQRRDGGGSDHQTLPLCHPQLPQHRTVFPSWSRECQRASKAAAPPGVTSLEPEFSVISSSLPTASD